MDEFQARYDAQRVYLQRGQLKKHFIKVGHLILVALSTPEPLLKKYFNSRAQALYISLQDFWHG